MTDRKTKIVRHIYNVLMSVLVIMSWLFVMYVTFQFCMGYIKEITGVQASSYTMLIVLTICFHIHLYSRLENDY